MRMIESSFPLGWHVPAKLCDTCKTAVALLYCRKDSLFICLACDVKLHSHTRHERVWMCEVCEQAPASVTCKADAAALCVTCDRDIHSANPLSRRHDRIPVVPFHDCADILLKSGHGNDNVRGFVLNEEVNWGIPEDVKAIEMLFPESDNLLDIDFAVNNSVNDSVVPFQLSQVVGNLSTDNNRFEIDFTRSDINPFNKNGYLTPSINNSVSSSSIEAGIVPDSKSVSEISHPYVLQQVSDATELSGLTTVTQQATQLTGTDREARVMRYREKRKNRKFEKTIRYASRKAYAETRPRIKGRFAKRTESGESDVDRWLFTAPSGISSGIEVEYGVVPSYYRGL